MVFTPVQQNLISSSYKILGQRVQPISAMAYAAQLQSQLLGYVNIQNALSCQIVLKTLKKVKFPHSYMSINALETEAFHLAATVD